MINVTWTRKGTSVIHTQVCWTLTHALAIARELLRSGKAENAHIENPSWDLL